MSEDLTEGFVCSNLSDDLSGLSLKEIPIETHYGTERSSTHVIYALRFFIKVIKYQK